jgi:spore coat polysaccharide biosynthesis predicted glycosyltransferase SpsG
MGDLHGCLALAYEFRKLNIELAVLAEADKEAVDFLCEAGLVHIPATGEEADAFAAKTFRPDCLIVNLLKSEPEYLSALKKTTGLLVTIDDDGPGAAVADLRFNPLYPIPDALVDPAYIPLKEEFQRLNGRLREYDRELCRIIITLGGSDTYGFTSLAVRAVDSLPKEVACEVILGPAFQHEAELATAIADAGKWRFSLACNARDMHERMFAADLAICGGGLTLFELACTGTPAVVICGEPFEEQTAADMETRGFGINLGFGRYLKSSDVVRALMVLYSDVDRRVEMGRRGRELVDGRGSERIAAAIFQAWRENKSRI